MIRAVPHRWHRILRERGATTVGSASSNHESLRRNPPGLPEPTERITRGVEIFQLVDRLVQGPG